MGAIVPVKLSSILSPTHLTTSATVGVDQTLDPERFLDQGNVAKWVDRVGGIALLYPTLTISVRPPTKASRIYKIVLKYISPTADITAPTTVTGIQPAPSKAYDLQCVMEFMMHERSTLAERQAFFSRLASLFATTITASDAVPSDATGSPLLEAVTAFGAPY